MVEQLFCNIKSRVLIWSYTSYFYGTNCYFIEFIDKKKLLIVDPGGFIAEVFYFLQQFESYKIIILVTHEHFDHHISLGLLDKLFDITIFNHSVELLDAIKDNRKNISHYSNFFLPALAETLNKTYYLEDIKVISTPGHSQQSYCYILDNICFSGDTIIEKQYTVLKLPGSNKMQFVNTKEQLRNILSDDTLILPGHGEKFTFKNWYLWKK